MFKSKPERSFDPKMEIRKFEFQHWSAEVGIMALENGRVVCKGYSGKRNYYHDFYYSFTSLERAESFIENYIESLKKKAEDKLNHAASKKQRSNTFLEKLEKGMILVTSWGYEQTNVEFFEVIQVKGCSVYLREISSDLSETGFMSGNALPRKGEYVGEIIKRVVRGGDYVKISESRSAHLWDGRAMYRSWYA